MPTQLDKWTGEQEGSEGKSEGEFKIREDAAKRWHAATAGTNITHHRHEAEGNSGEQTGAAEFRLIQWTGRADLN